MRQSVSFDRDLLVVLTPNLRGSACKTCDRRQAVWQRRNPAVLEPVCSQCVWYAVEWEGKDAAKLAEFVEAVEAEKGQAFGREADGRLRVTDADVLVAALVLASRLGKRVRNE